MEQAIREELGRYVRGEMSLSSFYAWFGPNTWDIEGDPDLVALCGHIHRLLSEYTGGKRTEEELRCLLREIDHHS